MTTTNEERAAKMIADGFRPLVKGYADALGRDLAVQLADAGVLAPDSMTYEDTSDTVPPNTLAVGSKWDDADALTLACRESGRDQITMIDCDGDVYVWDAGAEWWQTGFPTYGYAPYTILHAGRKADQ